MNRQGCIALFLLILISLELHCQHPPSFYFDTADSLHNSGDYDNAIVHFEHAVLGFDSLHQWYDKYASLVKIASLKNKTSKFKESLIYSNEVLKNSNVHLPNHSPLRAMAHTLQGISYIRMDKLESSIASLRNSMKILDLNPEEDVLEEKAFNFNALGNIYNLAIFLDSAIFYYEKSLDVSKAIYGTDHPMIGWIYNNMAATFYKKRFPKKAITYYKKSLNIKKKHFGDMHIETANAYNNIGSTWIDIGNFAEALKYLKTALNIRKNYLDKNHFSIAESYVNIGQVFQEMKNYDSSRIYHRRALTIYKSVYQERLPSVYLDIGNTYFQQKNYDEALTYFHLANKVSKNTTVEQNIYSPVKSEVHRYEGLIYMQKGDYQKAMTAFHLAINYGCMGFQTSSESNYPNSQQLVWSRNLNALLAGKTDLNKKLYEQSGEVKYLNSALSILQIGDSVLRKTQLPFSKKEQKELNQISYQLYKELIDICFMLHQNTGEVKFKELAFYYSDRSKEQIMFGFFNDVIAIHKTGVPDSLLTLEKQTDTKLSYYETKLTDEKLKRRKSDAVKMQFYENEIFSLNEKSLTIRENFRINYPRYFNTKYRHELATIDGIREKLLPDQSMVEFFEGDQYIYAFLISKSSFRIQLLPNQDSLKYDIQKVRNSLKVGNVEGYVSSSYKLYSQLLKPLSLSNKSLIIIPDGTLWHLNFDALITETSTNLDFRKLNYLIKKHVISYATSATHYSKNLQSIQHYMNNQCLAFSYEESLDQTRFDKSRPTNKAGLFDPVELRGTQLELKNIESVINGEFFYGNQSIKKTFINHAKNFNILHLALHGEVNDQEPNYSKLIFSTPKGSNENNVLHAFELYNTKLNADLAVLSACNTGDGKIEKGEGVMSLGRAFYYAGCRGLVLSRWKLSDKVSAEIMKLFYENLTAGLNKSESLRNAKLTYLSSADNPSANPYYWSSTYQLGNDLPLFLEKSVPWSRYFLSALVSICLILLLIKFGNYHVSNEMDMVKD